MRFGRISSLLVSLVLLGACSRSNKDALPDVRLTTLSAGTGPSLASCPTPKCLTVYVAPWCGYCRRGTPMIKALRAYLKDHGVATRIVVGMDELGAVEDYAAVFGGDTLLDPRGAARLQGVPHFYVTDPTGAILREVPGIPLGLTDVAQFAAFFDLP